MKGFHVRDLLVDTETEDGKQLARGTCLFPTELEIDQAPLLAESRVHPLVLHLYHFLAPGLLVPFSD